MWILFILSNTGQFFISSISLFRHIKKLRIIPKRIFPPFTFHNCKIKNSNSQLFSKIYNKKYGRILWKTEWKIEKVNWIFGSIQFYNLISGGIRRKLIKVKQLKRRGHFGFRIYRQNHPTADCCNKAYNQPGNPIIDHFSDLSNYNFIHYLL